MFTCEFVAPFKGSLLEDPTDPLTPLRSAWIAGWNTKLDAR
jgi:hypothetical protein